MSGAVPDSGAGSGARRQRSLDADAQRPLTQLRRVVCAPNAFKRSLSAQLAAEAMASGVRDSGLDADVVPVADGGDGTLDVLLAAHADDAATTPHTVSGPLGQPLPARLGWIGGGTAVVELAEASGLRLLRAASLDALAATSRGTGQLIAAALDAGARRVVVGVGGSACTDGGAGLMQALGARLLDAAGDEIGPGGGELTRLDRLDLSGIHPGLRLVSIDVATDVRNPLCGPDGAATVFGPQKGAGPAEVETLDAGLARLAQVSERDAGAAGLGDRPGTGAAGGCGFGLALLGAQLLPGAALVCDLIDIDEHIARAALVLTGEGRLDAQTVLGKAPAEVAERSKRLAVPCAAIAGQVADPLPGLFRRVLALTDLAPDADTFARAEQLVRQGARLLTGELLSGQAP